MYKKQLRFQKIVCLLAIIAAAVCFLYSLGVITDIYDSLYFTMSDPDYPEDTFVEGSIIYYQMQPFIKQFVNVSIGLILLACLLFLTNTNSRRRYYIGNYVSVALYSVGTVAAAVWYSRELTEFAHQFMTTVNFEQLKMYSEMFKSPYLDSTSMLDLHRYVAGFSYLVVALLIGNVVWKIVLMRGEKKLIKVGEEAAV